MPKKIGKEIYLTVKEVLEMLPFGRAELYRKVKSQNIPCYLFNRRYYFKQDEILSWIEDNIKKIKKG